MSYVFRLVFIYFVVLLVVYNGLIMFPAIAKDPTMLVVFKVGVVLTTIVVARAIFKTQPKAVGMDDGFGGP